MPHLVNHTDDLTLQNCLKQAVKETTGKNEQRKFFAITCYFDFEAIESLAICINNALHSAQGKLAGFYVFVDMGDWLKNRTSTEVLVHEISTKINLSKEFIRIFPINFKNRLFHAKSYCLVSPPKKDSQRRGFVIITSGNLTNRGLGINQYSNIEIVEVIKDSKALEDFLIIARDLKNKHSVSEDLILKQDKFLLAIYILAKGQFYHKWEGSLSNEIRFKLTLTDNGIKARKVGDGIFRGYQSDSRTISRDPINLQSVFVDVKKPFPQRFWALYSVDTLLGRWVPDKIAELVDERLNANIQPYIKDIMKFTEEKKLQQKGKELLKEVNRFRREGYVKERPEEAVSIWLQKVRKFRGNNDLIKLRIFNYERVPDILDSSNRSLIIHTFDCLCRQIEIRSSPKGLRGVLKRAISNGAKDLDSDIQTLRENCT